MKGLFAATALFLAAIAAEPVAAQCDYHFSGRLLAQHNGERVPLQGVKVRVKRQGGTGAGRKTVTTDSQGRFGDTWRFARDRDGIGPGRKNIRFAVQAQFNSAALKISLGGRPLKPWDTLAEVEGKDCIQFILRTHVFNADAKSDLRYTARRAYLYAVPDRLLQKLRWENVGLKSQLQVIYPDRHVYSLVMDSSWYIHKSHIVWDGWSDVRTLIHETMHQWDVNWLKGEKNLVCIADAHHKPPSNWRSSRCSGFMEGFAEATARAIFNDLFAGHTFYSTRGRYGGPQTREQLRNDNDTSGSIRNLDEAERNDDGWRNFLQFIIWENEWASFENEGVPNLRHCQPGDVNVYTMLRALKAESASKSNIVKGNATFAWFARIMQRRVSGFSARDARFYRFFGNPSLSGAQIQQEMCADELARQEETKRDKLRLLKPKGLPDDYQFKLPKPRLPDGF